MLRISQPRYPHLYHQVLENIPNKYPVTAYGSWATFEAHLPDPINGIVSSLSDVDYLTESIFLDELSYEINTEIHKWSRAHCIALGNVSVRSSHAINNLWSNKFSDEAGRRFDYERYIVFWTMIGMIELAVLNNQTHLVLSTVTSYGAVKFFFRLARNLLYGTDVELSSYQSLTKVLAKFCPSNSLNTALQVKIGRKLELPIDDLQQLFSPNFYKLRTFATVKKVVYVIRHDNEAKIHRIPN